MSESNEEIRYILKFYYKKGKNATQAAKKNCDVYGTNAISVRVAQIWFKRFQFGNFDIKDARRSGRPVTDKIDAIFEKVEQDRHISSYDVAGELGIDHKTVLAHLKKAGYTKKLDIWVPHELTERNLMNRVLICDSLLRRNETEPFLKKLITGDEKWITYDKNVRKRSWSEAGQASHTVAKPGLTRNKVMLLKQKVERKRLELNNRRGVVFHHDNARPHTSLANQQKLREFVERCCKHQLKALARGLTFCQVEIEAIRKRETACGALDTALHTLVECAAWAPQRFELETHVGPVDSLCDLVKAMLQSSDNWGAAVTFCETVMSLKEAAERDRERSPAARANASSRGRRPSAGTRRGRYAHYFPP
ncbi:hypothetical protein K1T71_009978 [Dendrolimus kikuchii]|uniref:Uncharacterized protein n=1 Tax=Dendrolimus kikuchii TaxID=765133 RepID=A0ACC1CTB9_9NEOP|nr:hypothetical protein K1T71_009978 [Dendrolimus kikuchii]